MFANLKTRAKKIVRALKNDKNGSVLIQTAFAATVLIGALGIGVDMARAYLYRAQLSGALDSAALAGSKAFHSTTRNAEIQAFFDSNFDADYLGGNVGQLVIDEVDLVNKSLSVTTSGTVDTVFMKLFGFTDLSVAASAQTTSRQTGIQLVMVLDATGSMRQTAGGVVKMEALKTASTTLVNSLFGTEAENENLEIAILPYVTTVNVGHLLDPSYMDMTGVPTSYTYDATDLEKWNGCVEARGTNSDLTAADTYDVQVEHNGENWAPFMWKPHYDNVYSLSDLNGPNGETWPSVDYQREGGAGESTNHDGGPNINCPAPALDFTNVKADLTSYITNNLYYSYNRGGTIANLGMIWGWRMLHTGTPFNNAIAYDDPKIVKAAVLMTDGENWIVSSGKSNKYYNKNNNSNDNNDAWDDDGDGRCPQCVGNKGWDWGDEDFGDDREYNGDYSGYGIRDDGRLDGATGSSSTSTAINKRLAYVCSAMKGQGITLYTITFGSGAASTTLKNLYEGCATDAGKYYHAPNSAELEGAFEAIANDLADLRLSK